MRSLGADCGCRFTARRTAGAGDAFQIELIKTATAAFTNVI